MRILVISDSHGDKFGLKKVIQSQEDVSTILFCGDGFEEIDEMIEKFPQKTFYCVKGNCDILSNNPLVQFIEIENKKIMLTHGHTYYVKSGEEDLIFAAKNQNVDIIIYGHTHCSEKNYKDGIHIINPGSVYGNGGTFAIIDIERNGILPTIIKRKTLGF